MKRLNVILCAVVLVVLLLIVNFIYFVNDSDSDKVKVGVISIMSGDFAVVGEQVERSIKLALEDIPNSDNFEFVFEDGKCDKVLSTSAARKLIDVDGVSVILAAGCSDTTIAIAPIANSEEVVVIMPSTGGTNIDDAGEYVFRNGNSDVLSATQPARDFINEFGYGRVAIINDQTEAMEDIRQNFVTEFEGLGGEVVLDERVSSSETDFRTIILKIKTENPDAIFINSQTGITGAYFIKQAKENKLMIPIFTNFNTATNTQTYDIVNDMRGVYFYDPDYNPQSVLVQDFLSRYNQAYGSDPPLLFHSIATRDSVEMTVQVINSVGDDGVEVHDWLLSNIKGWNGYMGEITFDEKGNSQSGYVLKKIVSQGNFELVLFD